MTGNILELLSAENSALLLVDYQRAMYFDLVRLGLSFLLEVCKARESTSRAAAVGLAGPNLDTRRQQSLSLDERARPEIGAHGDKPIIAYVVSSSSVVAASAMESTDELESMMSTHPKPQVVVGVVPGQPDAVVVQAAVFALHFGANLTCAFVDSGRYVVEERPDGTVTSLPFDPDLPDLREEVFDPELRSHLAGVLEGRDVLWGTRALVGDPAVALGRLADSLDAAMIVVGTREPTLRGTMHEFLNGSVAARLAHRQHRPVVVVPLNPVSADSSLPGERTDLPRT